MMNTWIVIPAYNEEKKIGSVISKLTDCGYQNIIVINDGSKDTTYDVATALGVEVRSHIINRGQGAALRTGIEYALLRGAEIIVTFDSDDQHQAKDIARLILPIVEGRVDVVLGSRFLDTSSNTPLFRKMMLKGGALSFRFLYGVTLTDSHNGLRALSRNAAEKIIITQDKMEHASEIVEEIGKKGLSYMEVPVTITYSDYSLEKGQKSSNGIKILSKMIFNKLVK